MTDWKARRAAIWNRGAARASLMGHERTMNPSAAAHSILKKAYGTRSVARAIVKAKKRRRSFHRGNPLPAAVGLLGSLGKLGGVFKRFGPGSDRYGPDGSIRPGNNGPLATTVQDFMDKLRTSADVATIKTLYSLAHNPAEKHRAAWLAVWNNEIPPRMGDLATAAKNTIRQLDPSLTPGAGAGGGSSELGALANSPLAATLGKTLIQQAIPRATRARSSARVRQVTRYDPATGDKYKVPSNSAEAAQWPSRKPSARSLSGVAGGAAAAAPVAAKAAGLAGAGAGAIAGVVIGGLAVGVLLGTGLRKLFGTAKAVRAEEAAVQGALELRNTRATLEAQLGRKLNATETKALHGEYVQQLIKLGFVQNAQGMWHRPRSTIERILG